MVSYSTPTQQSGAYPQGQNGRVSLTIRPWHKRHDRRQQDAWPAPAHPFTRIWSTQAPSQGPRVSWAVELLSAGEPRSIGRITLRDRAGEVARLGIYLSPAWIGQGYGRAALRLFVGECFTTGGLKRLVLDVAASNIRALSCYMALGFLVSDREWRAVGDDPALALLDQPEYADWRPHFRDQLALFFELVLTSEQWCSNVSQDAIHVLAGRNS
jgi:RimJ/RimL family protein N-acetyltransferase